MNIAIVRKDATTVTFQDETYAGAAEEVAKMAQDQFYRLNPTDRVFMSNGRQLMEYTVGELCEDVRWLRSW